MEIRLNGTFFYIDREGLIEALKEVRGGDCIIALLERGHEVLFEAWPQAAAKEVLSYSDCGGFVVERFDEKPEWVPGGIRQAANAILDKTLERIILWWDELDI